jgi:hypothetical protein
MRVRTGATGELWVEGRTLPTAHDLLGDDPQSTATGRGVSLALDRLTQTFQPASPTSG